MGGASRGSPAHPYQVRARFGMDTTRMADRPEFRRIEAFLEAVGRSGGEAVELGPGDDAAILALPPSDRLVLSSDLSVENVHFRREWMTWEEIGYRAAAAALSDLAAMAAVPVGVLAGVALPPELDVRVFEAIGAGIGDCLGRFDAPLVGGDLSRSPGPVMLDLVVAGRAAHPIRRSGAQPGDELWITGRIGGAGLAAAVWDSGGEPEAEAMRAFRTPVPRIREARWLADRVVPTAMIDVSDGMAGDALHLAAASDVRLIVDVDALPLHPSVDKLESRPYAVSLALTGGEDYELLFVAGPGAVEPERSGFISDLDVELTRIGRVEKGEGVRWVDASGAPAEAPAGGFDHFPEVLE